MLHQCIALHGFLGRPSDWDGFAFPSLQAPDFTAWSWDTLSEGAFQLNQWIENQAPFFRLLMGYSLGGRLALHALIQRPDLWSAAIIISAHPGLFERSKREQRLKNDESWAKRFESEPWDSLMQAWNQRDVFTGGNPVFNREEKHYCRFKLAKILRQGSLGYQEDLRSAINHLPMPILWIVGQKDMHYHTLASSLAFQNRYSKLCILSEAGHRAPWEQSHSFKEAVMEFMLQV